MKSFRDYISEDIFLRSAKKRTDVSPGQNFSPFYAKYHTILDSDRLQKHYDQIKSFRHRGMQFKLLSTRDEDLKERMFIIAHVGEDNKLRDIGRVGVLVGNKKELINDRVQTQLGRKPEAISLEPELHEDFTGKGLMSRVYKMIAKHHKVDIISDLDQTKGSKKIWDELAKTGRVRGVHTRGEREPFSYDPKNEDHVNTIYTDFNPRDKEMPTSRGNSYLLHYTH